MQNVTCFFKVSNADQFKLPEELDPKEKLPFSWKWSEERQDDFDQNPKNCSGCRKTSRGMPSVGCDFCSNVYHLDCLDPPLCEIPRVSAKRDPNLRAYQGCQALKSKSSQFIGRREPIGSQLLKMQK